MQTLPSGHGGDPSGLETCAQSIPGNHARAIAPDRLLTLTGYPSAARPVAGRHTGFSLPNREYFGEQQTQQRATELGGNKSRYMSGRDAGESIAESPRDSDCGIRKRCRCGKPVSGADPGGDSPGGFAGTGNP